MALVYLQWEAGGETIQAPYESEEEALSQAARDTECNEGIKPVGVFDAEGLKLREPDGSNPEPIENQDAEAEGEAVNVDE